MLEHAYVMSTGAQPVKSVTVHQKGFEMCFGRP